MRSRPTSTGSTSRVRRSIARIGTYADRTEPTIPGHHSAEDHRQQSGGRAAVFGWLIQVQRIQASSRRMGKHSFRPTSGPVPTRLCIVPLGKHQRRGRGLNFVEVIRLFCLRLRGRRIRRIKLKQSWYCPSCAGEVGEWPRRQWPNSCRPNSRHSRRNRRRE